MFEFDPQKIKAFPLMVLIVFILALFVPGYLFIFLFKGNLFMNLDGFRLTTLALAITTPFIVGNTLVLSIYPLSKDFDRKHPDYSTTIIGMTAMATGLVSMIEIYLAIIIGYYLELSAKSMILVCFGCFILLPVLEFSERLFHNIPTLFRQTKESK